VTKAVSLTALTQELMAEVERLQVTVPGQVWTDDAGWLPCDIFGQEPDGMCRLIVAKVPIWVHKRDVVWHRAPLPEKRPRSASIATRAAGLVRRA
jgi:hypothetical protein